jgi:hypothetical protein
MSEGGDAAPAGGQAPAPGKLSLGAVERRIIGCLVEKALATPDYYPMTLKALVAACNQRNNRDPVMSLDEEAVREGLSRLQREHWVMAVKADTGWATRHRHELDRKLGIQVREQAVLAELLLRGPQTEGELRARASRMREIKDHEELMECLEILRNWKSSLVVRISPPGMVRGVRYAHCLYPEAEMQQVLAEGAAHREVPVVTVADADTPSLRERVASLEERVARVEAFLRKELGADFDGESG